MRNKAGYVPWYLFVRVLKLTIVLQYVYVPKLSTLVPPVHDFHHEGQRNRSIFSLLSHQRQLNTHAPYGLLV